MNRRAVLWTVAAVVALNALVWLVDIAGLSRHDAVELMRWSARAMYRDAIAAGPPSRAPNRRA